MINKDMILIEYKETLKNFKDHLYNIFCSYIRKDYKNTKGDYIRTIELARPGGNNIKFIAINSDCLYKIKGVHYTYEDKELLQEKYDLNFNDLNFISKKEIKELGLFNF